MEDAIEFVKEFGWDEAKFYLGTAHVNAVWMSFDMPEHGLEDIFLKVCDLKRLVESWELVEKAIEWFGDMESFKAYVAATDEKLERGVYFKCLVAKIKVRNDRQKQAIVDVESCQ